VRRPRVLMVVGSYAPEITGGGLQCRTLVAALGADADFRVLATARAPGLPAQSRVDGADVHRVVVPGGRHTAGAALGLARTFRRLLAGTDIVHFHGFTAKNVLLQPLARLARRRVVLKASSIDRDDPVTVGRQRVARAVYASADRFVSISPGMTARFRAAGLPIACVREIPNGVDLQRFRPATPGEAAALRARLGLWADRAVVVFVGFFSRDKAPDVLARACSRLPAEDRPQIVFIGSTDPSHSEVDATLVTDVRGAVARDTRFIESTDHIEDWLRAADVLAAPSRREALSNAVLEAMACGLPVIASLLPGVTDFAIENGVSGRLVPPGNAEALSAALMEVVNDPDRRRRLGAHARSRAEAGFDLASVARQYLTLYRELAP
jgi:glycosyltransferase involved in cell wall biosynthesis